MARLPAARTSQAADEVLAWAQRRTAESRSARPDNAGPHGVERNAAPNGAGQGSAVSLDAPIPGRLAKPVGGESRPALGPAHTDWLYHPLEIIGRAAQVIAFRQAAAGAGVVPWRLDLDRMEEDFFLRLAAPSPGHARALSLDGARLLAAELRDAVARRHALAVARVGQSSACPFDLHALLPVSAEILQLGPDDPDALAWLWTHWGTTQALRHVSADTEAGRRRSPPSDAAVFVVTFWSADWTPWRALATLRARWPALRLAVTPSYELA